MKKLVKNKSEIALKIVPKGKKTLTKNQQLFNKLTKRIENLEIEIINENSRLDRLLVFYLNKLRPLLIDSANIRLKLAMTIGDTTNRIKYSKKQLKNIKEAILALCKDAFIDIEPNNEQESFYDQWSKTSYKNEVEKQEEEAKEILSDFMNQMFGMDIDMNEFENTPEGAVRFEEKLRIEFEKAQENESNQKRKKTKKQIQQEEQIKAEEDIKNKSIRSIYIALAKLLHPDSETDVTLKAEKEEIMKKVTSAYDQKDLSVLLKLEMEWVHKETEHLEKLTEDKLKIYISALKEQVSELEQEKLSVKMNPRFADISQYSDLSEKTATNKILSEIKTQNKVQTDFTNYINDFEKATYKNKILDFVDLYLEVVSADKMFDDMFDDMFDMFNF